MSTLVHRGGDRRFVLQSEITSAMIGFMICGAANESWQMFAYNFGSTYDRHTLQNVDDFPELKDVQFYAVEYLSAYDYDRCLNNEEWAHLRPLFLAEGKAIGYSANPNKSSVEQSATILWQHTPPNLQGSWRIPAWGLWVDGQGVWMGNRNGLIIKFDHDGQIANQFELPKETKCLVGNDRSIYASCDDGNLYELTGKLPQSVYQIRSDAVSIWSDFLVYSLEITTDRQYGGDRL